MKSKDIEVKISDIDVATQVLHEDIKELVEETKMLIIRRWEGESKKHVDKEQSKAHASYSFMEINPKL